jgi:hypothetical protein
MDVPVFHLDFVNNRVLIAVIAILHVVINHSMAVGGIPLVAMLERQAWLRGDEAWDRVARHTLSIFFIVTTTVGALTGVGIWFSAALVNPYAIGSLLRVFFWTWFTEWLVFVTEVALILAYFLTWNPWAGARKRVHVRLGFGLAIASWTTMALIVSILSFMMDPGAWRTEKTLFSGMLNPIYVPQLAFRTPLSMVMAGGFGLVGLLWTTERQSELRARGVRVMSGWLLAWIVPCLLGGAWYAHVVPVAMRPNLPVALVTQALEPWSLTALWSLVVAAVLVAAVAIRGAWRASLPGWALVVPAVTSVALVATFERVREFIRKPYVIADYMYSNGFRKEDYPLLNRDGLLARATYTSVRKITPENEIEAGREVFVLACTRCHTSDGVNGVRDILARLYGSTSPWSEENIASYLGAMSAARPFMPPFPGNDAERSALAAYLVHLQSHDDSIEGAQSVGVTALPPAKRSDDGVLSLTP